jgi:uncharacterized membrane protein
MSSDSQFLNLCRFSIVVGFLVTVLPAGLIVTESVFTAIGQPRLTRNFENIIGSTLCHHLPSRTISVGTTLMPVCARCTGLYLGFAFGTLLGLVWPIRNLAGTHVLMMLLAAGGAIAVGSAALEGLRFLSTSNTTRLFLGLPLGLAPSMAMLLGARSLKSLVFAREHSAT